MNISTTPSRQSPRPRAAFSLVELLVVVSIIALLVALLLPTLGRARESANSLKCAAQEQQIFQALMIHAHDHKGYMALTGMPSPGLDPASLEDPNMEKYDYYGTDSKSYHLMSLQGALAPILGQKIDTTSKSTVEADIQQGIIRNLFVCPSDREGGQLGSTVYDGGVSFSSYAFNDAVFGWATSTFWDGSGLTSKPYPHSRLRGKVDRFVRPSELFLFADANPRSDGGWQLYCDADADLTLRDIYVSTSGPPNNPHYNAANPGGLCSTWDLIDTKRHRGRMNVAFADGHVENYLISEGELSKISMNKGFPAN